MKTWIPNQISKVSSEPISQITYYTEYDNYQHESIVENLNDERCDTLLRGLSKEGIIQRDNIFLTPHFIQNFEFTKVQKIRDYGILRVKFKFAANQLGFDVLRQNLKQP